MLPFRQVQQPTRIAALRLFLVLLAWAQVSHAAHQFEHSLDDADENCSVCLLFDRYDDVNSVADHEEPAPGASPLVAVRPQAEFRSHAFTPYLSRASP